MQKNPYENVIAVTNRSLCQRPFAEQIERVCSLHPKAVTLDTVQAEQAWLLLQQQQGDPSTLAQHLLRATRAVRPV